MLHAIGYGILGGVGGVFIGLVCRHFLGVIFDEIYYGGSIGIEVGFFFLLGFLPIFLINL